MRQYTAITPHSRPTPRPRPRALRKLALATDYRDVENYGHTERVGRAAALIARELGLARRTVALIRRAAPLHDIGKIGISDDILMKPGGLSEAETEAMQEHVLIGARMLAHSASPVLRMAQEIVLAHHERWDGTGYPYGRCGGEIPLSGRIVAVADVFDALTHERPYKPAWRLGDALDEIKRCAGGQFDPQVVRAFAALDHPMLLWPIEEYDLDLRPSSPSSTQRVNGANVLAGPLGRGFGVLARSPAV